MLGDAIRSICSDPAAIMAFAGVVAAVLVLVCLLLILLRGRKAARRAMLATRDLIADLKSLREQMEDLEKRFEKRLDGMGDHLAAQVTGTLTEQTAALEERMAGRREDLDAVRQRLDGIESQVPRLLEELNDFRETLGRTFQTELSGVLSSFDASVAGILEQMRAELQMGISRIEGIEQMVKGREKAEKALLTGSAEDGAASGEDDDARRFAEWKQEALDLAERDDEPAVPDASTGDDSDDDDEAEDHPGEMRADEDVATDAETDAVLESALYDEQGPADDADQDEAGEEDEPTPPDAF